MKTIPIKPSQAFEYEAGRATFLGALVIHLLGRKYFTKRTIKKYNRYLHFVKLMNEAQAGVKFS